MSSKKNKADLIFDALKNQNEGKPNDLSEKKKLEFTNLDLDSIRPKRNQVDYASVKIRTELYERIKHAATSYGIKQPGKFISLILETYLQQVEDDQ